MMKTNTGIYHYRVEALNMEYSIVLGEDAGSVVKQALEEFPDFEPEILPLQIDRVASTLHGFTRRASLDNKPRISTVMLLPQNTGGQELRTIAHEATHAVWMMCDHAGVEVSYDNQELFALLVEHIFETIRREIYGTSKTK